MSNELIEAIKQALYQQSPFDDDKPDDYEAEAQAIYAEIADRVVVKVDLAGVDELVGRLREQRPEGEPISVARLMDAAADTIQSLAAQLAEARAENDRLRTALRELVEEYVHNVDSTRIGGFYLDPETEDCVIDARAALKGSQQ